MKGGVKCHSAGIEDDDLVVAVVGIADVDFLVDAIADDAAGEGFVALVTGCSSC